MKNSEENEARGYDDEIENCSLCDEHVQRSFYVKHDCLCERCHAQEMVDEEVC